MRKIVVKKGLDIPLSALPSRPLQSFSKPSLISLNLTPFEDLRFKLLVQEGGEVKIGTQLLENKAIPGQFFVSPASGVVKEIRRGPKRLLRDIVIETSKQESYQEHGGINIDKASQEEIVAYLLRTGLFAHIRMRPFDLIAHPKHSPRAIFVKACESLPYVPSAEMQIEREEESFQIGLRALQKLTMTKVYLVFNENTTCKALLEADGVEKWMVSGPHPSANSSVHIHHIAPILDAEDVVWTLSALDVVILGKMVEKGRYHVDRVISMAGEGILEENRGYFRTQMGIPIASLLSAQVPNISVRLISGDPLTGNQVNESDFLNFFHTAFTAIPENTRREPFHFLRLGLNKYSAHRAYLTGHIKSSKKEFSFTTNQHGEERAFIDGSIYDKVMPMKIPTMYLVRAILAEDFDLAQKLGLLEVSSEDFALSTFICPSKIEMVGIVKKGLAAYSRELGF